MNGPPHSVNRPPHRRCGPSLRELAESRKETDRRLRKLNELFSGQWGKLMEALVEGDLSTLLKPARHQGPITR